MVVNVNVNVDIDEVRNSARTLAENGLVFGFQRLHVYQKDERRFYASARGSALECAGVLDAMEALQLVDTARLSDSRELLIRIVSMLTKMIKI